MISTFYLIHLKKQLSSAQFKLIGILLPLIQSEKQVRLERLSRVFPYLITTEIQLQPKVGAENYKDFWIW
jgi:hypothetical protein